MYYISVTEVWFIKKYYLLITLFRVAQIPNKLCHKAKLIPINCSYICLRYFLKICYNLCCKNDRGIGDP